MTKSEQSVHVAVQRRAVSSKLRAEALTLSGGRCAFPQCEWTEDTGVLELAHIDPIWAGGVPGELENLIVLCSSHHRLVDRSPESYSQDWLREIRTQRRQQVLTATSALTGSRASGADSGSGNPLVSALARWESESHIADEEHWQRLLGQYPACLAAPLQGRAYTLLSKCYVGGKSWDNTGGNVVDFLARQETNTACIEIKSPMAPLLGSQYRNNTFLPSKDLLGGWLQVLESRRSLMEEANTLNKNAHLDQQLAVPAPHCFLIIGNQEVEKFTPVQATSFELYRQSVRGVSIYTFDELFAGVRMLVDATSPDTN